MGVRARLTALVLLILIPMLTLTCLQIEGGFASAKAQELQANVELADAIGIAFDNYLDSLWATELAIGDALSHQREPLHPEQMATLMRDHLGLHPTVKSFAWLGPDGKILASTKDKTVGMDLSQRPYIQQILQGSTASVSELRQSQVTGDPIVVVSRGVRGQGRLLGIVMAILDVQRLGYILPVQRAQGRPFGLADAQGVIVFSSIDPSLPMERRKIAPDGPAAIALRTGERSVAARFVAPVDGVVRMGAAAPTNLGFVAFATVDEAVALAPMKAQARRDLTVVLLVLAGSSLAVLLVAGRLVRPIMDLQAAARAIEGGDLTARVNATGSSEIAETARMFDQMAGRIQASESQLRSRADQQGAVAMLGLHALAGLDLPDLMDEAVHLCVELLQVDYCKILELLPGGQELLLRAGTGWQPGLVGTATVSSGPESQAGYTLLTREPVLVTDLRQERRFAGQPLLHQHGVVSGLTVIIHGPEMPYGVVGVHTRTHRSFTNDEVHFLQAVANVLATAIEQRRADEERSRLLAEAQSARKHAEAAQTRLALLAEASRLLSSSLDYDETLNSLAHLVVLHKADWCVIHLVEPEGEIRRVTVVHRDPAKQSLAEAVQNEYPCELPPEHPVRQVIASGTALLFEDAATDLLEAVGRSEEHRALLRELGHESAMIVPLIARGNVLGAISLICGDRASRYSQQSLALAQDLAGRAAVALDNSRLHRALQEALAGRSRALAATEAERNRLHAIFAESPALIAMLRGPDHVFELVNPLFEKASSIRNPIGRPLREAIPEIAKQGFIEIMDEVYQTGTVWKGWEVPIRSPRADGTSVLRYFTMVVQPLFSAEGAVESTLAHLMEVTEQVRSRQALEAMAADLNKRARQQAAVVELGQQAFAGIPVNELVQQAIRLMQENLDVTYCTYFELLPDRQTLQVAAVTGWPADLIERHRVPVGQKTQAGYTMLSGRPVIAEEMAGEDRFTVPPIMLEQGFVGGISVPVMGRDRHYGVLIAHTRVRRTFTQDDVHFLQATANVVAQTADRAFADCLRSVDHAVAILLAEGVDAEEALPRILQAVGEGLGCDAVALWQVDGPAGQVTGRSVWHGASERAAAFAAAIAAGTVAADRELPGALLEAEEPRWQAGPAGGETVWLAEALEQAELRTAVWVPVRVGGTVHSILATFSHILRAPDGELCQTLGAIARHVAQFLERMRAEEALRELNTQLEHRVALRTAELAAANHELEAFSYSVSHDLRAPLRTIDGFSQALVEDFWDRLTEEGKDFLQRIRGASQRMGHLIDDLLRLSRLIRSEIRRETVDLSALARSVAAELQRAEPQRTGVTFRIADGLQATGDSRLLQIVLENLLGNAWKFSAHTEGAVIEFGSLLQDGEPVFFVQDNGAGFEMAYADKLFAPFQRLHGPSEFEGAGVGLATVQRIIARHGGQVWAHGLVDEGAVFFFTLQGGELDAEGSRDIAGGG